MTVKDFPNLSPDFIKQNPICAQAKTCLSPERLAWLRLGGSLPKASETPHFLSRRDFKYKIANSCMNNGNSSDPMNSNGQKGILSDFQFIFPPETKMIYQVVSETKYNTETFLQDSLAAMEALKNCLALDVEYSKRAKLDKEKLTLYQSDVAKNPKIQNGCERVWQEDSEIYQLRRQLLKMRQSLTALNLLQQKAARNEDDLVSIAHALKQGDSPGEMSTSALNSELTHLKGGLLQSSFWDGTPGKLEAANDHEKAQLAKYLSDLRSRFPRDSFSIEEALKMDYFQIISENPVLTGLSTARPSSAEIFTAFQIHQKKWQQQAHKKNELDDMDYLKFPSALQYTISQMPPHLQGDYCVLAADAIRLHEQEKHSFQNTLMVLTFLEGGAAAWVAKGAIKKGVALLFGAQLSGNATLVLMIDQATTAYNQELSRCLASPTQSEGMCKVNSLETNYSDSKMNVAMGMMLAFGGRSGARTKLVKAGAAVSTILKGSNTTD